MTELAQAAARQGLTEKELRKRLGRYVAPPGLYDRNKARPFVGKVTCNVDRLVAGQWTEIVLDYEIGASGVAAGGGFEHPEESCWRAGPTDIGFRTDTYGDSDSVVVDISNLARCRIRVAGRIDSYVKVGDPTAGNPFVHCPSFDWEVSGAELLAGQGRLRLELGGCELFLSIERIADAPTPREVTGTLEIEPRNGPHGFRPVYFYGRQTDDAKGGTSAMFIEFNK